ncbi:mitochondrial import inner membrane translocase subunit Tim29 [Anoplophora glabripennis]|uniref:mitochondrial import inner membrane translocase subunit Tim29 n=1 Tax=Anoplophora glabripennis TaxID=217634 RepID=UPI0008753D34|nr:mitochondrial import inner membrane translocase subunit Tim29 [Anoplophora glabripennis]
MNFSRINYSNVGAKTTDQWKIANKKINNKIKGTIFEKWVQYWKQIAKDYSEVTVSLRHEMKEKPLKSVFYISGLGLLGCLATHNPNLQSFRARYIQCANDLALVNSSLANPDSVEHLKYIDRCFNANLIRYTNLGIASIIWVDNFSSECNTYESNCSYLKVPYRKFTDHILDVGFLNVWWVISRKMLDYDINY